MFGDINTVFSDSNNINFLLKKSNNNLDYHTYKQSSGVYDSQSPELYSQSSKVHDLKIKSPSENEKNKKNIIVKKKYEEFFNNEEFIDYVVKKINKKIDKKNIYNNKQFILLEVKDLLMLCLILLIIYLFFKK
jgi:hypothetical protein